MAAITLRNDKSGLIQTEVLESEGLVIMYAESKTEIRLIRSKLGLFCCGIIDFLQRGDRIIRNENKTD